MDYELIPCIWNLVPSHSYHIWNIFSVVGDLCFLSLECVLSHLSLVQLSVTQWTIALCDPTDCSMPGFPALHYLPQFVQAHVHRVGDAIQPSPPLSSPSPPAFNLSHHQGLFKWVSSSHQYWRFSFNISPSNEYSGLISFRIGWFDLLAIRGTLKTQIL